MLPEGSDIMPQTIVSFKLEGFDELRTELYKLSKHFQRKGTDSMVNAGAEVVRNAAREIAKTSPVRAAEAYFSYASEGGGEYAGLTITGRTFRRNKAGEVTGSMVRKKFQPGWIAQNIFMGRSKNRQLLRYGSYWRVFVPDQAWFAVFTEYGFTSRKGRRIPAHSFLRRAVKENIWKIIGAMQERLFDFLTRQNLKRLKVTKGW